MKHEERSRRERGYPRERRRTESQRTENVYRENRKAEDKVRKN
jgi:hypothetical protein